MKRLFTALIPLCISLAGCANIEVPLSKQIEIKAEEQKELSRSKMVSVVDTPYLGARVITRVESPVLDIRVTLRRKGTLSEICSALSTLTPVSVQVFQFGEPETAELKNKTSEPGNEESDGQLVRSLPALQSRLSVNFDGTLRSLLDHIATLSGYGWDFDARNNIVSFSRIQVRTFTIMSAPGKITYDNQITNKSKDTTNSIGGSVNQTVQTADTSSQTAQTTTTNLEFDVWSECEKGVKALLSSRGAVVINQGAGTITVRDTRERLRQVASYIDEINVRLSRQVALMVNVYALQVDDSDEAGFDLHAVLQNSDISIISGGLGSLGGAGSVTASIVKGKLKGSDAILKALRQWGKATQITSAGGVVMSNQPVPVLAIRRHAYLAGVSSTVNDYGQTSEVTPGEVTTGFAMTAIPHILDKRRVILQYNINLSSLDDLVEFSNADITVQLPQVSTRSFSQRTGMAMGQTLVLAGFEQDMRSAANSLGIFGGSRSAEYGKTILIVTIEVESARVL